MSKISFTETGEGTLYTCRLLTHEAQVWDGDPLPVAVCEAFGLIVLGASAEGVPTCYQRQAGSVCTEYLHTKAATWTEGKQAAHAGANVPKWGAKREASEKRAQVWGVGKRASLQERGGTALVVAQDGTMRPVDVDPAITALPEAVKECRQELRHDYIEQKLPATTKAAFSENAHRRATMLVERAEQGKRAFPRTVPPQIPVRVRGRV